MHRTATALATALMAVTTAACTQSINWEGSIEEALELSGSDGKPVMLYFTFHG